MKTIEKPSTNSRLGIRTALVLRPVLGKLGGVYPVMNERYPGISGSTHGERNERMPAANAAMIPTDSCIRRPFTPPSSVRYGQGTLKRGQTRSIPSRKNCCTLYPLGYRIARAPYLSGGSCD